MSCPRVSIGMPVLNAEGTVRRSLRTLLDQTFADFEIVVCDNASDDATASVVEAAARSDPRIRLVRFAERGDIRTSFQRTLEAATGEFFMFAPADDVWEPDFVRVILEVLEADRGLVGACGLVAFTRNGRFNYVSSATFPLQGTVRANLATFAAEPGENARVFGLFRREAFAGAFPAGWYPGWDFQMMARVLLRGGMATVDRVLQTRDTTPAQRYIAEIDRHYRGRAVRWLPHLPVVRAIWTDAKGHRSPTLAWNLAVWALRSHVRYAGSRGDKWGQVARWLGDAVELPNRAFGSKRIAAAAVESDRLRRARVRRPDAHLPHA